MTASAKANWQFSKISKLNQVANSQLLDNYNNNYLVSFLDPKSQMDQGRNIFTAGRFAEAAQLWESASVGFKNQGDDLNQALVLSYLSLAYQNLGDWQKAEVVVNNSLAILEELNQQKKVMLPF